MVVFRERPIFHLPWEHHLIELWGLLESGFTSGLKADSIFLLGGLDDSAGSDGCAMGEDGAAVPGKDPSGISRQVKGVSERALTYRIFLRDYESKISWIVIMAGAVQAALAPLAIV